MPAESGSLARFPPAQDWVYVLLHRGLNDLMRRCFAHIPTRVNLDVAGYGDVFAY